MTYVRALDLSFLDKIIEYDSDIVVYSIFFVCRSNITQYSLHKDFSGTDANAFNLIFSLKDLDIGLMYKDTKKKLQLYDYKKSKGIAITDDFIHTTAKGVTLQSEVLFSITLGTDKARYWQNISHYANTQGHFVYHPSIGWLDTGYGCHPPIT